MPRSNATNKNYYTQMPISYKRLNRVPLDVDEVMDSFTALKNYMDSGAYYVGQRIAITPKSDSSEYYVIMCVNKYNKLDIVDFQGGKKCTVELHFEYIGSEKALLIAYRNSSLNYAQQNDNDFILDNPNIFSIIYMAEYVRVFKGTLSNKLFMKSMETDALRTINPTIDSIKNAFINNDLTEFYVIVGDLFD